MSVLYPFFRFIQVTRFIAFGLIPPLSASAAALFPNGKCGASAKKPIRIALGIIAAFLIYCVTDLIFDMSCLKQAAPYQNPQLRVVVVTPA